MQDLFKPAAPEEVGLDRTGFEACLSNANGQ